MVRGLASTRHLWFELVVGHRHQTSLPLPQGAAVLAGVVLRCKTEVGRRRDWATLAVSQV